MTGALLFTSPAQCFRWYSRSCVNSD